MKIIGITGLKQSGKDTTAAYISEQLCLDGFRCNRVGFADRLKTEICAALKITHSELESDKKTYRGILQWWGTEYRRTKFGNDYWVKRLHDNLMSLPDETVVIIPDVRFLNEAQYITLAGGKLIRVIRAGQTCDDEHASETEQNSIVVDETILNNGTLAELQQQVKTLLPKLL